MGYKIVKPGNVPTEHKFTCPACGCEFIASGSALRFEHLELDPNAITISPAATCPYCGYSCTGYGI